MNKDEIFMEIQSHLIKDEKPSIYLNKIKDEGLLDLKPFNILKRLDGVDQSRKHHPEGSVWIHTMMVVDEGAERKGQINDVSAFMWALLLHDVGKYDATKIRHGRITSYDHDKIGEELAKKFLNYFNCSDEFIWKVIKLVRYHMQLLFISKNMPYGNEEKMKKEASLDILAVVFECDRLGRGGLDEKDKNNIKREVEQFKRKYV